MKKGFARKTALALLALCVSLCMLLIAGCSGPESLQSGDKETYTITFVTGVEGLTVSPIKAEAGTPILEPQAPTREGYRFGGWKLNDQPYIFNLMPAENLTLTASWLQLFTVTFDAGMGEPFTAQYAEGDPMEAPTAPTREGFTFVGWYLDGAQYTLWEMPARDITLVAVWQQVTTITFVTGADDFTVEPIVAAPGTKISAPTVRRFGYYLKNWLLNGAPYDFTTMPEHDITLVADWMKLTNLPAMFIDLSNAAGNTVSLGSVTREAYVNSVITLTNTEAEYELDSLKSQFKGRGNGSWEEAKKGYKIKFDKKQSVFGREKNKHWVIIACTNFDDVTMSRNYLAYNMASEVFDGIEYTTPAYWIDVYVNGEYQGVYLLCEHVRVDDGRVEIESEYGVEDTGYLIEYDAYAAGKEGVDYFRINGVKYPFTLHSPDPEDREADTNGTVSEAMFMRQVAYIKNYVQKVYTAVLSGDYNTFCELVDIDSFVDMYILHELFKNVDTGYSSFYLYKKPGGKLYAGPAWDFDATCNGATDRGDRSPQGIYVAGMGAGTAAQASSHTSSELYINLYRTAGFKRDVKARWKVLSPNIRIFIESKMNDEVYEANKVAMGKNFAKWKNRSQSSAETTWVNDMKTLKQWLLNRVNWLDTEWA